MVREVQVIDMLISFFLMIIISTSLTVRTQPSSRFHVEAWLPFRNCEMDYSSASTCVRMFLNSGHFSAPCSHKRGSYKKQCNIKKWTRTVMSEIIY